MRDHRSVSFSNPAFFQVDGLRISSRDTGHRNAPNGDDDLRTPTGVGKAHKRTQSELRIRRPSR